MKILLLAMPDTVDLIDQLVKFPNIAVVSLAGNLPGHEVKVIDLVVYGRRIKTPLTKVLDDFQPELIGLSAMTFQFDTLLRIASFIKHQYPGIRIVAGGYHASLMAEEVCQKDNQIPIDFLISGEGEKTFPELCRELGNNAPAFEKISGLSFKNAEGQWIHNPRGELLDLKDVKLPDRDSRIIEGFRLFRTRKLSLDIIETSRGCPYACKFCSIRRMYGNTFRTYPIERIIADIKNIKQRGSRGIFFADDNITYDIQHFRQVCQAIIDNNLNDMFYIVQVTAAGIANNPELVADMDKANFRIMFVGFESMLSSSLQAMKKPTNPDINIRAANLIKKHNMGIIAGLIVGFPEDTKESIKNNFRALMKLLPDIVYPQYLTPYPKTELRDEMLAANLVVNIDDFSKYDGFTCNIRTKHLSRDEVYIALRKEMFMNFCYPSIIINNYLIRKFPYSFLSSIFLNFLTIIWDILTRKKQMSRFDI